MIRARKIGPARAAFLAFAFLALAVRIAVPAGFMTKAPTNDLPFAIVLCTGQGMVSIEPGQSLADPEKSPPPGSERHDSPCAFAGHGAPIVAPLEFALGAVAYVDHVAAAPRAIADLAPGRGLPAPPPPARGPPILI